MTKILYLLLIICVILLGLFYSKENEIEFAPDENKTYLIAKETETTDRQLF